MGKDRAHHRGRVLIASPPRRQRGIALLTAIILVALATMLAVAIAFQTAMTARRGASSFTVEQGLQFGTGAEVIAAYALVQDARQRPQLDRMGDDWTRPIPPTEVAPEVLFEAALTDESGKFNLNALVNPVDGSTDVEAREIFAALLTQLDIDTKWASLMADWIDTEPALNPNGAEDSTYTSQRPPHRTPNAPITSVSELMSLPGFSREDYLKLLPHVTALPPESYKINVCFASAALLDALESKFSGSVTQTYTKMPSNAFVKLQADQCGSFRNAIIAAVGSGTNSQPQAALGNWLTEQSEYFRLHTWVTIGSTRFALYSLMERKVNVVRVVNRTFGTE